MAADASARLAGRRGASGQLPETIRSRDTQGGSISSTTSSSGCFSEESAASLGVPAARVRPFGPSDGEPEEEDDDLDGPSSLGANNLLYQSRLAAMPRSNGRRLEGRPPLHRAATFADKRRPEVAAPMSEFSAFTLRKSFKSGLLAADRAAELALFAKGVLGPPRSGQSQRHSRAGSANETANRMQRNREEKIHRKTTPVRQSATIKLTSSGSRDNKLQLEHYYCCCCAGHCEPGTTLTGRLPNGPGDNKGRARPQLAPGKPLRERRCGVQRHYSGGGGASAPRRPLPVAPPVVPLHKEMALFGEMAAANESVVLKAPTEDSGIARSDNGLALAGSTTRPTNLGFGGSSSGSHLHFQDGARHFKETPAELRNGSRQLEEVELANAAHPDKWRRGSGANELTNASYLRPRSALARSSPHLSEPIACEGDAGAGSSLASRGPAFSQNSSGATLGKRTAGRLIGLLRQSFLFNFAAAAPSGSKLDCGETGGDTSSSSETNDCEKWPIYDTPAGERAQVGRPTAPRRRAVVRPAQPPPPPPAQAGPRPSEPADLTSSDGQLTKRLEPHQGDCAPAAQSQRRARPNERLRAQCNLAPTNDRDNQLAGSAGRSAGSCEIILDQDGDDCQSSFSQAKLSERASEEPEQVSAVTSGGDASDSLGAENEKRCRRRHVKELNEDDNLYDSPENYIDLERRRKWPGADQQCKLGRPSEPAKTNKHSARWQQQVAGNSARGAQPIEQEKPAGLREDRRCRSSAEGQLQEQASRRVPLAAKPGNGNRTFGRSSTSGQRERSSLKRSAIDNDQRGKLIWLARNGLVAYAERS